MNSVKLHHLAVASYLSHNGGTGNRETKTVAINYSFLGYQGYGRGLDLTMVKAVNNAGTLGLKPDLTIMLDIAVEKGFARKKGSKQDRFEQEELSFHRRVREGYLKLATAEPGRWLVVDASQSRAKVERIIWQRVNQLLPGNRG